MQGIGYSNDIAGGFAQYMPLAERLLLEVPNGLPADKAALTEPIAVGWHAVQNARLAADDVPLVIGCGPVGLSVIAGLTIRNVHPIIAADFSPGRRALALRMGADVVIDPAATSPYQSWQDAATPAGYDGSRYAQLFGSGPKQRPAVIFECVGVPGVIQQIIDGAPAGARIVVVGVCMETDRFEPFFGIVKQLNLQFVLGYTARGVRRQPAPHRRGQGGRDTADHRTCRAGGREGCVRRTGEPRAACEDRGPAMGVATCRTRYRCMPASDRN